jgi:predicted RNA-binding Zn-ribbon protein involved in translation (DUF1610 family)
MKPSVQIARCSIFAVMLVVGLLAAGCASNQRQSIETNGILKLHQITTAEDEQSLKAGDAVAMVCTRCKSVVYLNLAWPDKALLNPLGENHPCPECKATIKRVRVGKTHQFKITHVCEKCGEDSVFCCATRKGATPTKEAGEK